MTLYDRLGGAEGVRALVDRFYDRMDAWPGSAGIRAMHPADLAQSREKLYDFLCGWTGGPERYVAKHGHPRLRARHLPFPIASPEAAQWMACMRHALAEVPDEEARRAMDEALANVAEHMRNREG